MDRRNVMVGTPAPVKISISSKGRTVYVPTNVSVMPEQWDRKAEKVISHPQKAMLNTLLSRKKVEIDTALYGLHEEGKLHGLNAQGIKKRLMEVMNPDFRSSFIMKRLDEYAAKQTKPITRHLYSITAKKIRKFMGKDAESLRYEDVTVSWLNRFDEWMRKEESLMKNTRNVYLRNIRTIFNEAIDDGATDFYPFRKFKIKVEPTMSRALTLPQLRSLFAADLGKRQQYLDIFRLSFCLGGISFCDLVSLKKSDVTGGRVEFRRQKTGQFVSILIQPEAQAIIDKYAGKYHLINVSERLRNMTGYLFRMSYYLRHIGMTYNKRKKEWEGDAVAPAVSQYWARYTFATIAAELGFGEDAVAAVLGHHTNSVTSIYIRANRNKQVDAVVRAVLDAV
jgi:integrase